MDPVNLKEIRQEPNKGLIRNLEKLLREARAGRLQALAYAKIADNEMTGHGIFFPARTTWKNAVVIGELFKLMTEISNTADGIDGGNIRDN